MLNVNSSAAIARLIWWSSFSLNISTKLGQPIPGTKLPAWGRRGLRKCVFRKRGFWLLGTMIFNVILHVMIEFNNLIQFFR
jgi:hypothetical protein